MMLVQSNLNLFRGSIPASLFLYLLFLAFRAELTIERKWLVRTLSLHSEAGGPLVKWNGQRLRGQFN